MPQARDPKDEAIDLILSVKDLPEYGDLYRHYKGGVYEVTGVCVDENTLAGYVEYRPAPGNPHYGQLLPWGRFLPNFGEAVALRSLSAASGAAMAPQRRFERVSKAVPAFLVTYSADVDSWADVLTAEEVLATCENAARCYPRTTPPGESERVRNFLAKARPGDGIAYSRGYVARVSPHLEKGHGDQ